MAVLLVPSPVTVTTQLTPKDPFHVAPPEQNVKKNYFLIFSFSLKFMKRSFCLLTNGGLWILTG